jgi:hypothetical protein
LEAWAVRKFEWSASWVEAMLADLEEQAAFPGVAQKYAKDMLRQLIHRRADLIELKKQWLSFNRAIAAVTASASWRNAGRK